jgi:hypothetical protein
MTVNEVKQAGGSWTLRLSANAPRTILDALTYFGHIAIQPGQVNVAEYGDLMLANSRYVGVFLGKQLRGEETELRGKGMAYWLGDSNGTSDAFEIGIGFTAQPFSVVIPALLPPHGAVTPGVISALAGTYSGTHRYESPRDAIDYVTALFNAEWRVNGNGTLDAGLVSDLYRTIPQSILMRKNSGDDIRYRALRGSMGTDVDVEDYTTRVLLLAEGEGDAIATGEADVPSVPYKDIHGNDVALIRLVSESDTEAGNADARAALILDAYDDARPNISLSSEDYDVKGDVVVGDALYVYDPDSGLIDPGNEVYWDGTPINPASLRCIEMTWPIRVGWTVGFRDIDGNWFDLSPFVMYETGTTEIVVGELGASLASAGGEPIGDRPNSDSSVPVAPVILTVSTGAYQSDEVSTTKAAIYLEWSVPLNSDGSVVLDGDHYEVRYRPNIPIGYKILWGTLAAYRWGDPAIGRWGSPLTAPVTSNPQWQTAYVGWGTNTMTIMELTPGIPYEIQVRAVDSSQHLGPWTASTFVTTSSDNIPPSQPAAPTVAASRISIQVVHRLGKASGGEFNLEADLDHLDVHVGGASDFVPTDYNRVGRLLAGTAMLNGKIPCVGTFPIEAIDAVFVKVVAIDRAGNRSPASASATATATLIDTAHISDLSVSKVTAGTITADWLMAGRIATAPDGNRAEMTSAGVSLWNSAGQETVRLDASTANIRLLEGRLDVLDALGNVIVSLGKQPDGRYGLAVYNPAGAPMVRAGQLASSGLGSGYGMEAVDASGKLVELSQLAFGMKIGYKTGYEWITSSNFVDLPSGAGPTVDFWVGTSGRALIFLSYYFQEDTTTANAGYGGDMSFDITGATVIPPSIFQALRIGHSDQGTAWGIQSTNNLAMQTTGVIPLEGLNPGQHRIVGKYAASLSGKQVNFGNISIAVLPY